MAADRGDNLDEYDQLAIAQSARAAQARGPVLTPHAVQEYAHRPLLGIEEAVAIVQALMPLLAGTLLGPTYLDQNALAAKRLLLDVANGTLPMPCSPTEFAQWAKTSGVELPQPFRDLLPIPATSLTPPPPKLSSKQEDRRDCQMIAIQIRKQNPTLTTEKVLSERGVRTYVNKYTPGTVRKWLSDVDPRPQEGKPGPRRKRHASN